MKGVENEEYYYLYIKTEDENGKYISNEAVTLAQASNLLGNEWFMLFYGSSDFKWADFGDIKDDTTGKGDTTSKDDTTAKGEIPQTGSKILIFGAIILIFMGSGIFAYIKYKKCDF